MPTLDEVKEFLRKKGTDGHLDFMCKVHHVPDGWEARGYLAEGHNFRSTDVRYEFGGHAYRVTMDNFRRGATPDSTFNACDIKLYVDDEMVLQTSRFDHGVSLGGIKSLKAGDWIDALPGLIEAVKAGEKERMDRWKAEQEAKTMESIDLGDIKL